MRACSATRGCLCRHCYSCVGYGFRFEWWERSLVLQSPIPMRIYDDSPEPWTRITFCWLSKYAHGVSVYLIFMLPKWSYIHRKILTFLNSDTLFSPRSHSMGTIVANALDSLHQTARTSRMSHSKGHWVPPDERDLGKKPSISRPSS